MMNLLTSTLIPLSISTFILFFSSMISKKKKKNREKTSPFECGFDPSSSARSPFSIHFFLISILFLIFDIEISFILPIIKTLYFMKSLTFMMIMIILTYGLIHEWKIGILSWKM